uniref:HSF-type DNA-binding domain-containing protein n=1 Tax=Chaetoceros debilis TaxID=122233 RepID=A0A7S3QD11_9STRA|mmetsp:Transcript_16617/g.24924  ORF Transcript_16617/g.24924 Transcript_16617/m.24924 type:complete len:613 (-) Transcript_16617:89-1927(-)
MESDGHRSFTMDEKSAASAIAGWKRPANEIASTADSSSLAPHQFRASVQSETNGLTGLNGKTLEVEVSRDGSSDMEPNRKVAKTSHQHQSNVVPTVHMNNVAMVYGPKIPYVSRVSSDLNTALPPVTTAAIATATAAMSLQRGNSNSSNRTNVEDDKIPRELLPAPFFNYRDFSLDPDDDPLTPLTPISRVPNFPAKMHAILSRPDLADVVTWLPHGRSWRVVKPRAFEISVIPTYFEHAKFSSFIRQANGWGFRRITKGKDRNSYYHELFLRGLPHLCKRMKRPGVSKKTAIGAKHEPDFYEISAMHPVPEKAETGYNIMLPSTIMGGPKARMPVGVDHTGVGNGIGINNHQHQLPPDASKGLGLSSNSNIAAGTSLPVPSSKFPHQSIQQLSALEYQRRMLYHQRQLPQMQGLNVPSSFVPIPSVLSTSASPPLRSTQGIPASTQHQRMSTASLLPPSGPAASSLRGSQGNTTSNQQQRMNVSAASMMPPPQAPSMQHTFNTLASQHLNQLTASNRPGGGSQALSIDPTSQFAAGFAAAAATFAPHFQFALNQAIAANTATVQRGTQQSQGENRTPAAAGPPRGNSAIDTSSHNITSTTLANAKGTSGLD